MTRDKVAGRCTSIVNEEDNGGEQLVLATEFLSNGNGVYYNQTLTLHSYGNSASFHLGGGAIFTPKVLRELADEIEQTRAIVLQNEAHRHDTK